MVVYIVVIVVTIVVLYAAYRTMGGSSSVEVPPRDLLHAAAVALGESLDALDGADDARIRGGRRAASRAQALLDRLPSSELLDDPDRDAAALLLAATSDAAAAWRIASGAWRENPGLVSGVASLREHAAACLAETASLVGAGPEPVEGGA